MHKYLKIIKSLLYSPINKFLFFNLLFLFVRKFFKVGFYDECERSEERIDLVIVTISKDYPLLEVYLESLKNICHKINKIYLVSASSDEILSFCKKYNIIFIDEESVLGYGKRDINYSVNGLDRSGWIFQQILKLSGDKFVEMENYVIVDSDTLLINRHNFLENQRFVFFENSEWNEPYFRSFEKIFGYKIGNRLSFTSHMMIFNVENLRKMKDEMESKHQMRWDKVYLSTVDNKEVSCVSDYDNYAGWVFHNFPGKVVRKPLYNKSLGRKNLYDLKYLSKKYGGKLKSISFHSYIKYDHR